jgi:hypothetical protein
LLIADVRTKFAQNQQSKIKNHPTLHTVTSQLPGSTVSPLEKLIDSPGPDPNRTSAGQRSAGIYTRCSTWPEAEVES